MSRCYQSCEVLLTKIFSTKIFRILFIGIRWVSLGSLPPRKALRESLGNHRTMTSILREGRRCGRANGRITPSWMEPGSVKNSHNLLLMLGLPTSSQLSVNSTISLQIPLCKIFISWVGITPLRCSLIYMLKPVRCHLLIFVMYAWSLLMRK
jgi:hypothetical protein